MIVSFHAITLCVLICSQPGSHSQCTNILTRLKGINNIILSSAFAAPSDGKIDIEAIKAKVKNAKTKKLGAPPVNPTPPTNTSDKKKKKNKS